MWPKFYFYHTNAALKLNIWLQKEQMINANRAYILLYITLRQSLYKSSINVLIRVCDAYDSAPN